MDERWAKYKDQLFNMSRVRSFRVDKIKKSGRDSEVMYVGDLDVTKGKPWVLFIDGHQPLEAFKSKPEALKLAEDMINGKYDLKS